MNRSTLQRRIRCEHWRQGVHYRWVRKYRRAVLQFHLARIEELLQVRGWQARKGSTWPSIQRRYCLLWLSVVCPMKRAPWVSVTR